MKLLRDFDDRILIMIAMPVLLAGLIFLNWAMITVAVLLGLEYAAFHKYHRVAGYCSWRGRQARAWFWRTERTIRFKIFGTPPIMEQLKQAMFKKGFSVFEIRKNGSCYGLITKEEFYMSNKYESRTTFGKGTPAIWVIPDQLGISCGGGGNCYHQITEFDGIEVGVFHNPKKIIESTACATL